MIFAKLINNSGDQIKCGKVIKKYLLNAHMLIAVTQN